LDGGGYRGEDKGAQRLWVEKKTLGWRAQSSSSSVPESQPPKRGREKLDWEKLMAPGGFLRYCHVAGSSGADIFFGIDQNRRMSKDYERLCASGEAFLHAAMTRLMT
jgi:hypothetical protein